MDKDYHEQDEKISFPVTITDMNKIYQPDEDSFLITWSAMNFLRDKDKQISIIDIGTGSGFIAKEIKSAGFNNITASDINICSGRQLKKYRIRFIHSDLFSRIKGRFDLIIFNPPYLPEDKKEPVDSRQSTTAGKNGNELIIRFLREARFHLKKDGTIILLFSSLSGPGKIIRASRKMKYEPLLINTKKLFFEKLYTYTFKKKER